MKLRQALKEINNLGISYAKIAKEVSINPSQLTNFIYGYGTLYKWEQPLKQYINELTKKINQINKNIKI